VNTASIPGLATTASGTYVDLGGPAVTITVPAGATHALVSVTSRLRVSTGNDGCYMGFEVTQGGTTIQAASDTNALILADNLVQAASASYIVTLPSSGTFTFTAMYRSPPGNPECDFDNRSLYVIPLQ
jgi:hypothetical protein